MEQIKHVLWKPAVLATIASLLGFTVALAASGSLDSTFSGDGKQRTDISGGWNDEIHALALQSDGKIVAVGDRSDPANAFTTGRNFAVARYNMGGNLDSTFSGDGKLVTDFGGWDGAEAVAIQSDGKLVVSGDTCSLPTVVCNVAVARYKPGGALDTTFNGTGKKIIDFGGGDNRASAGLAIQSDGKIVIAGMMTNTSGDSDFAVIRLNSNGSLDGTFSGDGRSRISFGAGTEDFATDLRLQGSKIVVGGITCAGMGQCDFAVARLNSNGTLDWAFSGDGKQTTDFGGMDQINGLAIQSDGKIVAAGEKYVGGLYYFAAARYNTNGSLDMAFNGTGKKVVGVGTSSSAQDVLVQSDGKIVIGGIRYGGLNDNFALVRLNSNGSLDSTFSGDGKVTVDFAGNVDDAYAMVRQTDGKYVLAGRTRVGTLYDFALARLLP